MKTKVSIIIIEVISNYQYCGPSNVRYIVDDDYNFISKYISTKSIDDTINDLIVKHTDIDPRYSKINLADFIHQEGSTESEVVYVVTVPADSVIIKEGRTVNSDEINIERKYEPAIRKFPRSITY